MRIIRRETNITKLLYLSVFLMAALKLISAKPINDSSSSFSPSLAAVELVKYYDNEYDGLAKEVCAQLKNITDEILKDVIVQKAATPLMEELRNNLREFQQYYSYFKRFGLNGTLIYDFADVVKGFYYHSGFDNNDDFLYVQNLLAKTGYNQIRVKQCSKFKTFLEEKFLIKFKELQPEIANRSTADNSAYDLEVLKWISWLKECQDYECFLMNFENYKRMHDKVLNRFFGSLMDGLLKAAIVDADNTTIFARAAIKDPRMSQLSAPLKQQLTQNLQDLTIIQDSFTQFAEILLFPVIRCFVLYKFDNLEHISLKERQLITQIFKDHGYEPLKFYDSEKKFPNTDYITQYENKMAKLSAEELEVNKRFSEIVDNWRNASSAQEKVEAMKGFRELLTKSDKSIFVA